MTPRYPLLGPPRATRRAWRGARHAGRGAAGVRHRSSMTATNRAPGALELIVLGAGPAYSDRPGDLGSGFLVRFGEDGIVLDLGQGTFNPLTRAFDPSALAAVA